MLDASSRLANNSGNYLFTVLETTESDSFDALVEEHLRAGSADIRALLRERSRASTPTEVVPRDRIRVEVASRCVARFYAMRTTPEGGPGRIRTNH